MLNIFFVFFFKQKTAYEVRISDWSSDVCSSDLDDTPELREMRMLQANLVGPAGYISMEDTEATELVQRATARDPQEHSFMGMALDVPHESHSAITENMKIGRAHV